MERQGHKIRAIEPGSIAEELELEPGDVLLEINGNPIQDVFDYKYYEDSENRSEEHTSELQSQR